MAKPLHLALFGITGPQEFWFDNRLYDWRDPRLDRDIATLAERAKFDMIFFADTLAIPEQYRNTTQYGAEVGAVCMDPLLTLANMAAVTERIGLTATISTTFTPPYIVARQLSTLDHLSNGRAGWNVVTSADVNAGLNCGIDLPRHDLRYDMADEHLAICKALWNSWEADAIVEDRKNKVFADYNKIPRIDFEGKYYRSRGPFNHPPTPQRSPVIIMAGVSPRGIRFAAENADLTIAHMNSVESMKKYTRALREEVRKAGRDPYSVKIFFALRPWIGATEEEAKRKMIKNADETRVEEGLGRLSYHLGVDLSNYNLDAPLPPDLPVDARVGKLLHFTQGEGQKMTIREIAKHEASREDLAIYGTAEQVAAHLGNLAEEVDADGFHFRHGTKDYAYVLQLANELIPALQKIGLFRTEYAGSTLREHLFGPQICNG